MLSRIESYKKFLLKAFEQSVQPNASHDDLLDWLYQFDPKATYQDYLSLRKQAVKLGYKIAFDLPLPEDEFKYRNLFNKFSQWRLDNSSTCTDARSLLEWLCNQTKAALTYNEFLTFTRVCSNKGLVSAIDIPISETDYSEQFSNSKYLKSMKAIQEFQIMADHIKRNYLDSTTQINPKRLEMLNMICGIPLYAVIHDLSPSEAQNLKIGTLLLCKKMIEEEYSYSYSGSNRGSNLYSLISDQLGTTGTIDKQNEIFYLHALKDYIKDTSDSHEISPHINKQLSSIISTEQTRISHYDFSLFPKKKNNHNVSNVANNELDSSEETYMLRM